MSTIIRFIVFTVLIIGINSGLFGITFYVDSSTGSDANNGSESKPFLTIQRAADLVSPGDIVIVNPGNYGRTVISTSGTSVHPIKFQGKNKPQIEFNNDREPILKNSLSVAITQGFEVRADYIVIDGFEITDIGSSFGGIVLGNEFGTIMGNDNNISNNYFHELNCDLNKWGAVRGEGNRNSIKKNIMWRVEGIAIRISGESWIVDSNDISYGTDKRPSDNLVVVNDFDAMRIFGRDHLVLGNFIHDYIFGTHTTSSPHPDAFQVFLYESINIRIERNRVDNIGNQFVQAADSLDHSPSADFVHDWTFVNNIFTRAANYGLYVHNFENMVFENNIVAFCGYGPIVVTDSSESAIIRNNIFYKNGLKQGNNIGIFIPTDEGSIVDYNLYWPNYTNPKKTPQFDASGIIADPMFVDASSDDFRLSINSPAINSGYNTPSIVYDYLGNIRTIDNKYDIGPYEYGALPQTGESSKPKGLRVQ